MVRIQCESDSELAVSAIVLLIDSDGRATMWASETGSKSSLASSSMFLPKEKLSSSDKESSHSSISWEMGGDGARVGAGTRNSESPDHDSDELDERLKG